MGCNQKVTGPAAWYGSATALLLLFLLWAMGYRMGALGLLCFFLAAGLVCSEKCRRRQEARCRRETQITDWVNSPEFLRFFTGEEGPELVPEPVRKAVFSAREAGRSKNQSQSLRAQMEYAALQSQINPHFLYNTLDVIRGQALEIQAQEIALMTEKLSRFFRYSIGKRGDLVTLADELKNTEEYFYIQHFRFEDRFTLTVLGEKEVIENCYIPKMTFQPIVENAIFHGLEKKRGKGRVTIRIQALAGRLEIRIADDGIGMTKEKAERIMERLRHPESQRPEPGKKHGIALINVNRRLKLLFGEEYGLHINSLEEVGTEVEISLPYVDDESRQKYRSILPEEGAAE
ncbi:sensor histidine kinase [Cuneatibacter sp. NSJ-177]|uniref:sensor histidine kinase n=1 Tax=Cuneatibacter sp. NSJ-177 TaxID=2931401 RepID=UPI001FD20FDA|nr:sensor histidine kinase [Cuneatibacter sp. NSJ-177]MCJ7835843.1 sensor histidine kinase [Cuneatibacter sp. NSJ-177]